MNSDDFEVRNLQTGDIVLERVKFHPDTLPGWLPPITRFVTSCYYNHAWIPVKNKIHNCGSKGVEVHSLDWGIGKEVCVLRPIHRLSQEERARYIEYADSIVGYKYDYFNTLFCQLIRYITFKKIWLGKKGKSAEKVLNCSEHATTPIHHVRGWFPNKYEVSPEDVYHTPGYYVIRFEGILK